MNLNNICSYISEKINVSELNLENYISTENMLPNKSGITLSANLPNITQTNSFDIGDVLVSNIRPYFKKIWYAKFSGGCSNDVLVFRANENIDSKFLYYILSDDNFFDYSMKTSKGTKMPRGDKTAIMKYLVPDFSPEVQRKIAGVLGALDDKIELNNKINQNLDLQAQSLFNEIYNSSENGVLSDIVDIVESGNRPKGGACPSGIPSIGAENIEKFGVYDFSKEKFVSEEFFNNMKRGKVQSGDVLLYKDGAYTGKVSMALDGFPHKKCALNEHVFLLRANDKCSQFFLYYCLSCDKNKTYLHNLACAKAAQPGLNQQELLGMPVFIPGYDKIEKFTDTVNPLMHKIAQNALENIKLSAIRDVLLPKLMSGEIDVENLPPSAIIPNE